MEILVDDKPGHDSLFEGATTLEAALRRVQDGLGEPDRVVTGLRCDGRDVAANKMAATLGESVQSVARLEVFTATRGELVVDAMQQASKCLSETEPACGRVAELLTQDKTGEAAEALSECLRIWQQIHDALAKSIEMLNIDPAQVTANDQPLHELIARPKETLMQVKQALQNRDHVLLADVLQYEFSDVIKTWHDVIATVRREAEGSRGDRQT